MLHPLAPVLPSAQLMDKVSGPDAELELLEGIKQKSAKMVRRAVERGASLQTLSDQFAFKCVKGECSMLCAAILCAGSHEEMEPSQSRCHVEGGDDVVRLLLDLNCPVDSAFVTSRNGLKHTAYAIHIAASEGIVANVRLLLDYHANPNHQVDYDGKLDATPLHEAVWREHALIVEQLIQAQASPNLQKFDGATPLHLVAKRGLTFTMRSCSAHQVCVASALVSWGADLRLQDNFGQTPLQTAFKYGSYPFRDLTSLLPPRLDLRDFELIVNVVPTRTAQMLREDTDGKWAKCIMQAATKDDVHLDKLLINFLKNNPDCAAWLIDACTIKPVAQDRVNHPLPQRSCLPRSFVSERPWAFPIVCHLSQDVQWTYGGDFKNSFWHNKFSVNVSDGEEIELRLFLLRDAINPWVFSALSQTRHGDILLKLPVQAMLRYAWLNGPKRIQSMAIVYDVGMLIVLLCLALDMDATHGGDSQNAQWAYRSACWCYVCAVMLKDGIYEVFQIIKSVRQLHFWEHFMNKCNMTEWAYIVASLVLCLVVDFNGGGPAIETDWARPRVIVGLCSFARWLKVLYAFRAFDLMGVQITVFIHSCFVIDVLVVTLVLFFVYAGFTHAYLALGTSETSLVDVCILTVRLLLLGEWQEALVDPVNTETPLLCHILALAAVLVFCIGIMNLFIGLIGETYSTAKACGHSLWLRERASICSQCMLRPTLSPRLERLTPTKKNILAIVSFSCGSALALMYFFLDSGVIAPMCLWLLTFLLADACLVAQPDYAKPGPKPFLWFSYPKGVGEPSWYPASVQDIPSCGTDGMLLHERRESSCSINANIKHDEAAADKAADRFELIMKELQQLRKLVEQGPRPVQD